MGLSVPIALPDSRFCFVFTCLHYNYNFNLKIMKKQFLLTRMLLLCALIIGSVSSAWGEEITYTFNSKSWGATVDEEEANWTSGKDGNSLQTGQGVQVTAGVTGANATSPVSFTNISKIVVTYSTNSSKGAGNIKIKIGDNTEKTLSVTKTGGTTDRETSVNVSPTESGNVKLTVDCTTNSIYVKSVTITYSSGTATTTTIDASGISNTDVYTGTSAGTLAASVTKNSDGSAVSDAVVTWSSNNEDVATINESTGEITLVALGTVTFTATYAGDATYAGSSDTYDMTVTSSAPDQLFFLVNDENDLAAGDKIIIVSGEKAMSTTQNDNNRGETDIKDLKETDGSIRVPTSTDVQILTLEGESGAWYLNTGSGYLYAASDTKNYLRTEAKAEADKDDNAKAVITFPGDNASIVFQGTNSRKDLRYNSSSNLFSCYASTSDMAAVQIYKYKATATVSINSACTDGEKYYGTYSNSSAFIVPADLTVSAISVAGNKLTVTNYNEGDIVKANTGVMVSSTTAGDHTIVLSNETGSEIAGNMLKASSVAMDGDNLFYRLTMHNGETIGFYWGAADGAAFSIDANKAYLAVPKTAGARIAGFNLFENEGEATAIEGVKTIGMDASVFNLNGQRVNGNAKGLLIKNGKKFMNR